MPKKSRTKKTKSSSRVLRKSAKRLTSIQHQREKKVLAYDIGGTKVHAAIITEKGRVLDEVRVSVDFSKGKAEVFRQWIDAGKSLLQRHPEVRHVGVASAGPLDPAKGRLLDPTNFKDADGKTWGVVPISKLLSRGLGGIPVVLENDAAAAVMAEHWVGAARGVADGMILTLGTGVGTGMMVDGKLVRAGKGLHTEGGHMIIRAGDVSAICGCGNHGCIESYLSGRSFERRARQALRAKEGDAGFSGQELAERARAGEPEVRALFEEYAELLAVAIHNFVVLYAPKTVVLAGSFANAADLFLEKTRTHLEELLVRRRHGVDFLPKVVVSSLENRAGVLGGAFVAFQQIIC
ncbi:MAG: ROK family protein [Bdellovibrionales bacterium]|nr:ROK family protein [Bdellovibrionales bacterium]